MKRKKLAAWFTRSPKLKKNIHEQIAETIAERKRILPKWEQLFLGEAETAEKAEKDIHLQLKETISAFKKSMEQHKNFFIADQNKKAA